MMAVYKPNGNLLTETPVGDVPLPGSKITIYVNHDNGNARWEGEVGTVEHVIGNNEYRAIIRLRTWGEVPVT